MVTDEPRGMWPAVLPWNTKRTLAQAWTPKNAKTHLKRGLNRLPGAHHAKR